jgi:hypothetical protein
MKVAWYTAAVLLGAYAALAALRFIELVATGGSVGRLLVSLGFSLLAGALAWRAVRKARRASSTHGVDEE